MKWYKHITTSLDDPFISELIEEFGGDGYLVYFGILEIMAREFDIQKPGYLEVSMRFLTKKLQLSRQKTVRILKFFSQNKRMFFKLGKKKIKLNCPKLRKMTDNWTDQLLRSNLQATSSLRRKKKEERSIIKKKCKKKGFKKFTPPTVDEVVAFFKKNGFPEPLARKAHEHYRLANWHDTNGKKVAAWKQKMFTVWFRDENKSTEPPEPKEWVDPYAK